MGRRGPQPSPWGWYQKRYPLPLKGKIDKLVRDWKKEISNKESPTSKDDVTK